MSNPDDRTDLDDELDDELVPEDDAVIGQALRWSLGFVLVAGALVFGAMQVMKKEAIVEPVLVKNVGAITDLETAAAVAPRVVFKDVTAEAGIDFVHESGARGEKLLPETMGAGAAFFDYDGDGDPDLFLVDGGALVPEDDAPGGRNRLYRNDDGTFVDVTSGSGIEGNGYGTGVAVGDYDGNGSVDVFTTGVGGNHLYRNDGGSFTDVTATAGVGGTPASWTTSAGFFDYDGDDDLDLFVCSYIQWSRDVDMKLAFTLNGIDRAYGPPMNYQGAFSTLYRNEGNGTFADVSAEAGIQIKNAATGVPMGKALGVVFVDVDRDGWLDVVVANDTVQNFLFHNEGDGTFDEVGALCGIGFDGDGKATGAMGIDVSDYRNDGGLGVCIGNFANEMSSLFCSDGTSIAFSDDAMGEGIGSPSRQRLSFGLFFFDYDLDGNLDLLQVNGHLEDSINEVQPSQHYLQPAQLFWNAGTESRGCFLEVPSELLGDLGEPLAGRGSCYADYDGDGDLDVLLTQVGARPVLLRNDLDLGHHWLRVRLVGPDGNRDAIGATVEVRVGDRTMQRIVTPSKSYLSQSELPVTFGLGDDDAIDAIEVVWPGGKRQSVPTAGVLDEELVVRIE